MLKLFRQNIKIVIWAIVLSFAAWGIGTLTFSKENASPYVGSVGGEKISHKEFLTTLRFYELMTRAQVNQEASEQEKEKQKKVGAKDDPEAQQKSAKVEPLPYEQLRSLAWQELVINREAEKEHIRVSDEEVRQEVVRLFSLDGRFDQAQYRSWIQNNFRGQARDFEETVRKSLMSQKMRERILKDVPEDQRNQRWLEWFLSVFRRVEVKDYEEEAERRKKAQESQKETRQTGTPAEPAGDQTPEQTQTLKPDN